MHPLPPEVIHIALEDAPDAMLIVDSAGTIRFANESMRALFGRGSDSFIGRELEALLPERFRASHALLRAESAKDPKPRAMGGQRLDLYGLRADGSEFPAEVSLKPVWCESEWLTVAAVRDLTHRAAQEHELREARARAERADAAKSRFLATASHDLRQPLQTLTLLNGTLRRIVADHAQALEAVAGQGQAIESMSRLVNALLDISKLESGAVKPEPRDFAAGSLFEELRSEFAGLAASKGLTLKVASCRVSLHSDPSLVGQILRNLVSNAIKYTRKGWVELRCIDDRPGFERIEVIDTGVGIPADQLSHIYEEFFQVDGPHNSKREGYGLGLSIVQRLVALLGLKIEVWSESGRGSSFALTLPSSHDTVPVDLPVGMQPLARGPQQPANILLVEDDPGVRNATRLLLQTEGYHVTAVAGLAEALEHVRRIGAVDLLLTDYHLADGELGTQVIAAVGEVLRRQIRAVVLTGDTSSAMSKVAVDRLTKLASKPVDPEELLSLLQAMLAVT